MSNQKKRNDRGANNNNSSKASKECEGGGEGRQREEWGERCYEIIIEIFNIKNIHNNFVINIELYDIYDLLIFCFTLLS